MLSETSGRSSVPRRVRQTVQREAIARVFQCVQRPLAVQEVHGEAQRIVPHLGIATVYRALQLLAAEGAIRQVPLAGGGFCYERMNKKHHHFFRCRLCERLFDVYNCHLRIHEIAPKGFVVEDHEVTLTGVCASCQTGDRAGNKPKSKRRSCPSSRDTSR